MMTVTSDQIDQMTDRELLELEGRILSEQQHRLSYRERMTRLYANADMEMLVRDLAQTAKLPDKTWKDLVLIEVLSAHIGRQYAVTGIA